MIKQVAARPTLYDAAIARWENEGGAPPAGRQKAPKELDRPQSGGARTDDGASSHGDVKFGEVNFSGSSHLLNARVRRKFLA